MAGENGYRTPPDGNGSKAAEEEPTPADSNSAVFRRLLRLLRPYRGRIILALILLILSTPGELFPAVVWGFVTDDVALKNKTFFLPLVRQLISFGEHVQGRFALLISSVVWLLVVYILAEVLGTLDTWILNCVAQKFTFEFRNTVYEKLQGQSLAYLQGQRTGDLMSRAMGDVDELKTFIVNGIDVIVGEGLLWLCTVVTVFYTDWRVSSFSLAPLIGVFFLLRIFNKKVRPIYFAARERLGDVSNRLQENLSGIVVIKIFNRERQEARRFRDVTEAYYDQEIRGINARNLFFPFSRVVGFFSNVFMIGVGGYYMIYGSFSPGKLVMFRAYWYRLFGPISTLARVNDMVQRAVAAARRVFAVLDAPEELPDAPDAIPMPTVTGAMQLRNVTFAYGPTPPVLHNVDIQIEPGKTVALCGPSGSGKSTILNLLLRFYDPTAGIVTLDNRDIRSITRDSLRSHFALVQQESFLFNDSILDNIRYGHGEATMEEVIAATKAANAHGFISKMPSGYDTKVGERGVRLSGGQKQRISIARAFLANPTVLLLDEPTSSVEPDSEAAIIAALDRLMAGRTTVLTSHRPSLINQADQVYVIEDGRVTASGNPSELKQTGGWFGRFMRSAEGLGSETEMVDESA
jgi:ABC-type multidrug transport system fused ATPase/permease subunit